MTILGVIAFVLGLVLAAIALRQLRRTRSQLRRIVATPTTPIAATPHGQVVEIEGTVAPSEQGVLVSPATGRQVVLFHVEVYDTAGTVSLERTVKDRREFWLTDASGGRARIVPAESTMYSNPTRYTYGQTDSFVLPSGTRCEPLSPDGHAWLAALTGKDARHLMIEEAVIVPGQRLLALGLGERHPDGTLFMRHHAGQDLVLSAFSEAELRQNRRREGRLALVLLLVFGVMCAVGASLVGFGVFVD
jgi:hypothetical protein